MSPEELYDELKRVTGEIGELRDVVKVATRILAMPRYRDCTSGPSELLARDIERVIAAIPEGEALAEGAPTSRADLRDRARWYFSLEGAGRTITSRRVGEGDPGGSARSWMDVGVIFRIALGLRELWAAVEPAQLAPIDEASAGYQLDSIDLTRHVTNYSVFRPMYETLVSQVTVLAAGPHLLLLPFEFRAAHLDAVDPQAPGAYPAAQLISVNVPESKPLAGVIFSGELGEQLRISVTHKPRKRQSRSSLMTVTFRVGQPTDVLWLGVEYGDSMYEWQVAENGVSEWRVGRMRRKASWSPLAPDIGKTYSLSGQPTSDDREEERTVQSVMEYATERARDIRRGQETSNML